MTRTVLRRAVLRMAGDAGAVTAEFAVAFPVIGALLALGILGVGLAQRQLVLQSAVSDAALMAGRADGEPGEVVDRVASGATTGTRRTEGLLCVTAAWPQPVGLIGDITLAAHSCALDDAEAGQ